MSGRTEGAEKNAQLRRSSHYLLPPRDKTRYDSAMTLSKQLTLRLPTALKRELEDYAERPDKAGPP
jgi:hypothetical protein